MQEQNTSEQPQEAANPTLTLELNLNEVNFILNSLGKEQFSAVSGLIAKIREQGIKQLNQK